MVSSYKYTVILTPVSVLRRCFIYLAFFFFKISYLSMFSCSFNIIWVHTDVFGIYLATCSLWAINILSISSTSQSLSSNYHMVLNIIFWIFFFYYFFFAYRCGKFLLTTCKLTISLLSHVQYTDDSIRGILFMLKCFWNLVFSFDNFLEFTSFCLHYPWFLWYCLVFPSLHLTY